MSSVYLWEKLSHKVVKALPKITGKGISKHKARIHELLTPSSITGSFHFWPSFHTVALLQSSALDFNDFVLSSAFSKQGEGWCGMHKPLLSLHVSMSTWDCSWHCSFCRQCDQKSTKLLFKPVIPQDSCLFAHSYCAHMCVYEGETGTEGELGRERKKK